MSVFVFKIKQSVKWRFVLLESWTMPQSYSTLISSSALMALYLSAHGKYLVCLPFEICNKTRFIEFHCLWKTGFDAPALVQKSFRQKSDIMSEMQKAFLLEHMCLGYNMAAILLITGQCPQIINSHSYEGCMVEANSTLKYLAFTPLYTKQNSR